MNKRITLDNLEERVRFRFADANDVPELLLLYEMFYEEAVYKDFLEWDRARARETILNGIVTDDRRDRVGPQTRGGFARVFAPEQPADAGLRQPAKLGGVDDFVEPLPARRDDLLLVLGAQVQQDVGERDRGEGSDLAHEVSLGA